jgi:hypothetical protein
MDSKLPVGNKIVYPSVTAPVRVSKRGRKKTLTGRELGVLGRGPGQAPMALPLASITHQLSFKP